MFKQRNLLKGVCVFVVLGSLLALTCFSSTPILAASVETLTHADQTLLALPGYPYYKVINISNTGSALTDYQVKVSLDSSNFPNEAQSDGRDLRFTESDGVTLLNYWIETYNAVAQTATIWVKVPSIPTSPPVKTIWMNYGNPSATSASNGNATFSLFDDFDPITVIGTWTDRAPLPATRTDGPAAVVINKLYFFGGLYPYIVEHQNTYEYDPSGNSWTEKASMPGDHSYASIAAASGSKVYVWGGLDSGNHQYKTLYIYDTTTDTWTTGADFPVTTGFDSGAAIAYGGKIYIIGGTRDAADSRNVTVYDPQTNTYDTSKAPMPTPRRWFSLSEVNGILYAIGGGNNSIGELATNEAYSVANDSWTTKTPMPVARWGLCHENAAISGKIYVSHGMPTGSTWSATAYEYDPATDSWKTVTTANHARDGDACGVINGRLYVVGGRDTSLGATDYVEELNPAGSSSSNVLDPNKWTSSGSPTVGSSVLSLTSTAKVTSIRQSGSGYAFETNAYIGNEAATHWLGFMADPDHGPFAIFESAGSVLYAESYSPSQETSLGGQAYNSYHRYTITFITGAENYFIDGNLRATHSRTLGSMPVEFRVYSGAATIMSQWAAVRKYAAPEPTITIENPTAVTLSSFAARAGNSADNLLFMGLVVGIGSIAFAGVWLRRRR